MPWFPSEASPNIDRRFSFVYLFAKGSGLCIVTFFTVEENEKKMEGRKNACYLEVRLEGFSVLAIVCRKCISQTQGPSREF